MLLDVSFQLEWTKLVFVSFPLLDVTLPHFRKAIVFLSPVHSCWWSWLGWPQPWLTPHPKPLRSGTASPQITSAKPLCQPLHH